MTSSARSTSGGLHRACAARGSGGRAGSPTARRSWSSCWSLIVVWYVAAVLMNVRWCATPSSASETAYSAHGPHRRHPRCRAAAGGRRRTRSCCSSSISCSAIRRIRRAASSITAGSRSRRRFVGFVHRRRVRHPARRADRARARAGEEPDAVDHLLADGADPGRRADRHRRARRDRPARACCRRRSSRPICASFPVTIGMVKGLTSPDPIQRDLMRTWSATPRADLLEAALAGLGAVPVREPQGRDHHLAGRRHRRRAADRRAGRHRRAAARRLLLRPDRADLGRAVRRRVAGRGPGRPHRRGRAMVAARAWERSRERPRASGFSRRGAAGAGGARCFRSAAKPPLALPASRSCWRQRSPPRRSSRWRPSAFSVSRGR